MKLMRVAVAAGVGVTAAIVFLIRKKYLVKRMEDDSVAENIMQSSCIQGSAHIATIPIFDIQVEDSEFSRWTLTQHQVWYDFCDDDLQEESPSAIAEFVLEEDVSRPQINIIAEDLLTSSTASEYVDRSRQGIPTIALDTDEMNLVDSRDYTSPDGRSVVDVCCCAFTEQYEQSGVLQPRSVISVVAMRYGVAVIFQLICRDDTPSRETYLPVFRRLCKCMLQVLASDNNPIALRKTNNQIQFGLPSVRQETPGVLMSLPIGRMQIIPSADARAVSILDNLSKPQAHVTTPNATRHPTGTQTNSLRAPIIACTEKRPPKGSDSVETYLIQMASRNQYERIVQDNPFNPFVALGKPCALRWRDEFLCFVVAVASTQSIADEHAQRVVDNLRPFHHHKRVMQYFHAPSGVSYSLTNMLTSSDVGQPLTMLTHYFGPFDCQFFPSGACSTRPSLRIAVREIHAGETFASFQRNATRDYDERLITKRPSVEGWSRLEVLTENAFGVPLVDYVTMLEHQSQFVHLVWTYPRNFAGGNGVQEEVRRGLHFLPLSDLTGATKTTGL